VSREQEERNGPVQISEVKIIAQELDPWCSVKHPYLNHMVRWMKATITQIESIVIPSGNSGHAVVPKA
jgi:hypothetical protein